MAPVLILHLDGELRASVAAGRHNFFARVREAVEPAGWQVRLAGDGPLARAATRALGRFGMHHMRRPAGARGLTVRRAYHYPFWAIERDPRRWEWDVARATYRPETIDPAAAQAFYTRWQRHLFGSEAASARRGDFAYVPLQGRLTRRRGFQSCSPLEMIAAVLAADPGRPVVAGLHPKERYGRAERAALARLAGRHPRLRIETGDMARWLTGCSYVATQTSAAGFSAMFFRKPVVLFGRTDFHHIAFDVHRMGPEAALHAARAGPAPDPAPYLWWYWQERSINAGRADAAAQISARLRALGWPV